MNEYHKIHTVFLRDPDTNYKTLLEGQFSKPEFEYLQNNRWIFTEKVDGTNIRVIWDGENITFKGKTDKANIPKPLVAALEHTFYPQKTLLKVMFPNGICFYGEGYGGNIQNGNKYMPFESFVLFDVKVGKWWFKQEDVWDVASQFMLLHVPVVSVGTLWDMVALARKGFESYWGNFLAEGFVARPEQELFDRDGYRIITKIKLKDFKR